MELFTNMMNGLNSVVWCMVLVVLCLAAGFYFSIRMKFPQVRLFKDMVHLLVHGEKSDTGITPFQAFAATVGSRVGMGNIAGVATAIFFGGPGAIFCAVLALVVCGGIKRIAKIAEYMAPVMCVIYVAFAFAVIFLNITKVPGVFKLIVTSAFGVNPVFGGIIGSAISWGVKRGIYSNEAGQGSGAIVCAAAECSHPAKQGLVQAFSVYIDTLIVCTSSALIILLSGCYNTVAKDGTTMLAEGIPGVEYGIRWAQNALSKCIGPWASKALAIIIIMFVFTSLMGYYYQAEANTRYLFKENKTAVWVMRIVFIFSCFSGVLVNGQIIWTMGDTGAGMMAWLNIIAILLLSKKGFALLKDYEAQKKEGKDPVFDPEKFGIKDETGVWDKYKNR